MLQQMMTRMVMATACFTAAASFGMTNYVADVKASKIEWLGKKEVTGDTHNGYISLKSGKLAMDKKNAKGVFIVDMKSIKNIDIESPKYRKKLEDHLKNADFFEVDKYPEAKLVIESMKPGKGQNVEFSGQLTIKKTTKPFKFTANLTPQGKDYTAKAKVIFNRADFDVRYNSKSFQPLSVLKDKVIQDDVELDMSIVLKAAAKSS